MKSNLLRSVRRLSNAVTRWSRPSRSVSTRILLICVPAAITAYALGDMDGSYILPQDHPAIQYQTAPVTDRIAALQRDLRDNLTSLQFEGRHGYLAALLKS